MGKNSKIETFYTESEKWLMFQNIMWKICLLTHLKIYIHSYIHIDFFNTEPAISTQWNRKKLRQIKKRTNHLVMLWCLVHFLHVSAGVVFLAPLIFELDHKVHVKKGFEPNEIHINEQFHTDDQFQMEREMAGTTIFTKCQLTTKTITNLDMPKTKQKWI